MFENLYDILSRLHATENANVGYKKILSEVSLYITIYLAIETPRLFDHNVLYIKGTENI